MADHNQQLSVHGAPQGTCIVELFVPLEEQI